MWAEGLLCGNLLFYGLQYFVTIPRKSYYQKPLGTYTDSGECGRERGHNIR